MEISIATPSFGNPPYLKECINSISKQKLGTAHIVCGGNLSFKDDVKKANLEIINQTPDPGMVPCWSKAASLAQSKYIGFCADDNSFQPEFTAKLVEFLETHPECDLVFCNQNHMDAEGKIDAEKSADFTRFFGRDLLPAGIIDEQFYRMVLEKGAMPLEACLIRREMWDKFGPFETKSRGSFDHEFLYRLLLNKVKIAFIPEYLMNFRWHDGAYSTRAKRDHLIGSIWTYESLMNINQDYTDIFKQKSVYLKGRLLRYKLPRADRFKIMKDLLKEKKGVTFIIKNSIIRVLDITKLRKNQ